MGKKVYLLCAAAYEYRKKWTRKHREYIWLWQSELKWTAMTKDKEECLYNDCDSEQQVCWCEWFSNKVHRHIVGYP